MPELPEVESVGRSMARQLLGSRIMRAVLHRTDVLVDHRRPPLHRMSADDASRALLQGGDLERIHRHGKQLALESRDGRVLVLHLGMSGRLLLDAFDPPAHTHAEWLFEGMGRHQRLLFVDPRRFGGLTAFDSMVSLRTLEWARLGPDALVIDPDHLRSSLERSKRPIKALLLDQSIIAGIGNIYADEILHRTGIHPLTPSNRLAAKADALATITRSMLRRAVELGGSTIRDYVDPSGDFGSFQQEHRAYGRAGKPCLTCGTRTRRKGTIELIRVVGRSTAFCSRCQPPPRVIHK